MRKRHRHIPAGACWAVICLVLLGMLDITWAQRRRYTAASLDLDVGARPLALGSAAVAMKGGPELFRYNPASLAMCSRREVGLMYAPTFGTIAEPMATFHYIGGAFPLPGGGCIGLHWTRFSVEEIPLYPTLTGDSFLDRLHDPALRPDGTPLGFFKDVEDAFYLSFARLFRFDMPLGWLYTDLAIEMPVGLNIKILRQSLYESSANGLGIDLGMMLRFNLGQLLQHRRIGGLSMGLSAIDLTRTTLVWDNQREEKIATALRWGVAYSQPLSFHESQLIVYWTLKDKYTKNALYGLEYEVKGLTVCLGHNESGLTAGAGMHWQRMRVEYAFASLDFEGVHRIGCGFIF